MKYLILAAMVLTSACSTIKTGRVYDKSHKHEFAQERKTIMNGVMVNNLVVIPERYTLLIRDGENEGYCPTTREFFNRVSIGQMVTCE